MKKMTLVAAALAVCGSVQAAGFDGFYSGINLGWAHPGAKINAAGSTGKTFYNNAMTFGVQAGYGIVMSNNLYTGGELNFNYDGFGRKKSTWNLSNIGWGNTEVITKKNWHITAAGKLGYNAGMFLPYVGVFAGFASHEAKINYNAIHGKILRRGLVYGPLLGADYKVTERLTAGLEGRMDFGSAKKKDISGKTFKLQPRGYEVRARLNFAF